MIDHTAARQAMVDGQVRPANVTRYTVIDAMLTVRRENFVPHAHRALAYADMQIPLGQDRVMLDPRTLGRMLDALEVTHNELALVIGAGLGYTAALLARIASTVVALEEMPSLIGPMKDALAQAGADTALVEEGPLAAGAAASGPFDIILVEGGVESMPAPLLDQLADGGRLIALSMADTLGTATLWRRTHSSISSRPVFNAAAPVLPGFDAARSFVF